MSFTSPEKDFLFYIYDVITWENKQKSADIYYSQKRVVTVGPGRQGIGEFLST